MIANDSFGPFGLIRSAASYGSGASSFGRTGVAGNSHYYAYDPQGTPFLVMNDGSGAGTSSVLTTYEDDAFGNQAAGNTAVTPASDPYVGFGGEWGYRTDAATGLELLEHRYYDPAAGRFVTRDPVGYEGGMDLYAYCNNQSIDHEDSSGTDPIILPSDPSQLPNYGYTPIPHADPNGGSRWGGPHGRGGVEFHPGKPGSPGWEGKNHYHPLKPKPGKPGKWIKCDEHMNPGTEFNPEPEVGAGEAAVGGADVSEVVGIIIDIIVSLL